MKVAWWIVSLIKAVGFSTEFFLLKLVYIHFNINLHMWSLQPFFPKYSPFLFFLFFSPLALSSLFTSMPTLPTSNPRFYIVCVLPHFTGRQTDRQTDRHTHTHRNDIHVLVYLPFLFNTSWESVQTNCMALNHSFQGYKIISCLRHTFDLMWIFLSFKKKEMMLDFVS